MAITEAAERLALYKIIDYLDEDPAEHIEKIMGLVNKFTPDDVFPTQRAAFSHAIEAKTNWYELMMTSATDASTETHRGRGSRSRENTRRE